MLIAGSGNILTWRQERAGSAAKVYTFTHDLADQLRSAVLTDTNTTPTILKRQAWAYDAAGNRAVDQNDDAVFATTHDEMNRLEARAPGGPIVFSGSLDEPGTVTIDGKPAEVDASNNFRGTANLTGATTTVTVKAKDVSGNETTKQFEVDASGSTTSYTYDANGNLTSDGTKTYYWNALNLLTEVKEGSTTIATFEYDGNGRRTEKAAGGLTRTYIYDAEDVVEERITGASPDTIRYFHGAGIDEPLARKNSADVVMYCVADHLGSVVQETSASGAVSLEREYGPWGDLLSGASTAGYAFQGREWDPEIALYYFRARYYNAAAGAWVSDDPIAFAGGPNFTQFVSNNPVRFVDPFGLCGDGNADNTNQPKPTNPDGTMKPPPVPVPRAPDANWKWNPNPQNKRDGTWNPERWKGPNPPIGSWDPEGHWDIDDGLGERMRYDKDGNPLTEKEAHRGNKRIEQVVTVVTVGYLIYRATRLVPSVAVPALWPTVPLNLAVP